MGNSRKARHQSRTHAPPLPRFHLVQVERLSFLMSFGLVAIANIDRPNRGLVKVSPEGFAFANRTLHNETKR